MDIDSMAPYFLVLSVFKVDTSIRTSFNALQVSSSNLETGISEESPRVADSPDGPQQ